MFVLLMRFMYTAKIIIDTLVPTLKKKLYFTCVRFFIDYEYENYFIEKNIKKNVVVLINRTKLLRPNKKFV